MKLIERLTAILLVAMLCLGTVTTAQAKIVGVGKAGKKSYVSDSDPKQVIIYVGDSRVMFSTAGKKSDPVRNNFAMCFVNGGNVSVIKMPSGKLTQKLMGLIGKYRSKKPVIVFNFGLNGNSKPEKNARRIIKIYKKWMEAYPDLQFYVESIGPTKLSSGSYSNPNVLRLNAVLKAEYEPQGIWIDSYNFIVENDLVNSSGKGLRDNYHFKWKTSKQILAFIRAQVEARKSV